MIRWLQYCLGTGARASNGSMARRLWLVAAGWQLERLRVVRFLSDCVSSTRAPINQLFDVINHFN